MTSYNKIKLIQLFGVLFVVLVLMLFGCFIVWNNIQKDYKDPTLKSVLEPIHDTVTVFQTVHDTTYLSYDNKELVKIDSVIYDVEVPEQLREKKFSVGYVGLEDSKDKIYTKVQFGTVFDHVTAFSIGCQGKVVSVREGWIDCTGYWYVKIKEPLPETKKNEIDTIFTKETKPDGTIITTKTWTTKGPTIIKKSGVSNCGCKPKKKQEFDGVI